MTISQPSQSQADYRKTAQAEIDLDQIMLFPTATLYGGSFDLSPSCRQAPYRLVAAAVCINVVHALVVEQDPRFRGGKPFPKTGVRPRFREGRAFRDLL